MLALPPLGLYIHVPWCVRKCPYCDFNSHEFKHLPEEDYLQALLRDFDQEVAYTQGRPLRSIFIGGGTPSLLSGAFYEALLRGLAQRVAFEPDIEITMEANPGTTEASRFTEYRAAGINRLSLGVQSFDPQHLHQLGRIHSADDAKRAFEQATSAGFTNINLDLMHGLPDQTPAGALADLEQALSLSPTHLSWYQLTIEPNTAFYSSPPPLPVDDVLWRIQEEGQSLLARAGFEQYEVSAYSQPGKQAQHNLNYWEFGDYLAIGAGAHGKVTLPGEEQIVRYRKTRMPEHYLKPMLQYRIGQTPVAQEDLPFEFMMNVLRLNKGVSEDLFTARTGLSLESLHAVLADLRAQGLVHPNRLAATERGRLFLNSVLEHFAP